METPEQRRDAAIQAAAEVGASVVAVAPMATTAAPHVIAAYGLTFAAPDPAVLKALRAVRADTETDLTGLIAWTPEEVETDAESPG